MNALMAYDWPGNVRELENCIERALALGSGEMIDIADLPPSLRSVAGLPTGPVALPSPTLAATDLEDIERATIERVFQQVNGDKAAAGKLLGISRATLYRKLRRFGLIGPGTEPEQALPAAAGGRSQS
jgi:transcriptional regulator of acetoin/glycerol metabolism